jgi:RNA polymerase sigma-70 factor (ECF subfamily)
MVRHPPSTASDKGGRMSDEESRLVEGLRGRDEEAFVALVRMHGPTMLRVARHYGLSRAVAEEVMQETWLAVLTGIGGFEGRSSFKTWLFRIHANRVFGRATKERRSVPFSALGEAEVGTDEPSVDSDRFRDEGERFAHHWTSSPQRWGELPEATLLSRETISIVERVAVSLPPAQRAVIVLRDIVGWDAAEVCEVLEITDANQRVLLHRARTKVRKALERHLSA